MSFEHKEFEFKKFHHKFLSDLKVHHKSINSKSKYDPKKNTLIGVNIIDSTLKVNTFILLFKTDINIENEIALQLLQKENYIALNLPLSLPLLQT